MRATIAIDLRIASPRNLEKQTSHWWLVVSTHRRPICCVWKMNGKASNPPTRDAVYQYLTAVFDLVSWWAQEGRAVDRAHRALHLRGHHSVREPEPFAAVIYCTADRGKGR